MGCRILSKIFKNSCFDFKLVYLLKCYFQQNEVFVLICQFKGMKKKIESLFIKYLGKGIWSRFSVDKKYLGIYCYKVYFFKKYWFYIIVIQCFKK